jgi:hypothetical protein
MEMDYLTRNGVEQTNEDLKNPALEKDPGSSILRKLPLKLPAPAE